MCSGTHSDTETIVHAYEEKGPACVADFNGDFAFALWDKRRNRLLLARDRMGVRPVYYTTVHGSLVFASEIKALLRVPGVTAELDPLALDQCFTFWFPLAPRTPFKGISELPPGHILVAEGDRVTVRPYWRLSYPDAHAAEAPVDEAALTEELRNLLIDATRIRAPRRRAGGGIPKRRAGFLGHHRPDSALYVKPPADVFRRLRDGGVR